MTKLFCIVFAFLCFSNGIAQMKSKMSFQAEISNRNTDSIFIRNRQNGKLLKTIVINKEGIFKDRTKTCQFPGNDLYYRRGKLIITRLDKQAGIISGTFSFTLYKPGCDSIRVTNGRFDRKL